MAQGRCKITPIGRFWHNLTAWNSGGEAVHSPYLFNLVRFVLRSGWFYCWNELNPTRVERLVFRLVNELYHQSAGNIRVEVNSARWEEVLMRVDSRLKIDVVASAPALVRVRFGEKSVDVIARDPEALARPGVTTVFDYYDAMLLFYDPHYLKRKYKMRM